MKFTVVFITFLSVSTSFAIKTKADESKDKRETLGGYPGSSHSSHGYQSPSFGHEDASSISVGAGYSVGGAKPSYSFGAQGSGAGYQLSSESLPSSAHNTIQLAPITLQSSGGSLVGNDLSQLMSQLSHGLNSGAITLQQGGGQGAAYQLSNLGAHGGQELAVPQYSYGAPKLQQHQQFALFDQSQAVPSYATGTKGLSSYSSTGPVLFTPAESHSNQHALSYGTPSASHSNGDSGPVNIGHAGLSAFSLGNSGHGLSGQYSTLGAGYGSSGKTSFKPSAFLGSSVQSDSGHALSSLSGSYAAPSFSSSHISSSPHSGFALSSAGHGANFGGSLSNFGGSSKLVAPSYLPPKSEGFGSLESIAAFSTGGHLESPPATTYGIPSGSFAQASSSHSPQYYVAKHSLPSSGFSGGSSYRAPSSGHSSLNSYSSGPKYSFGGSSSRYLPPKDTQGAYSETSYNTIKYSEELKPRIH